MYYDPPQSRLLNSIGTNGLTVQFLGKVFGIDGNHCYLSSSYVKRIGLHMKENNSKVILGNGLEVDMEGTVNVHVKIQQYQFQVSCLIIKLSDGFDMISEDNWLSKHKAHIDYDSKTCILHKGNKTIYNSKCGNKQEECLKATCYQSCNKRKQIKRLYTLLIYLRNAQKKESSSRLRINLVGSLMKE